MMLHAVLGVVFTVQHGVAPTAVVAASTAANKANHRVISTPSGTKILIQRASVKERRASVAATSRSSTSVSTNHSPLQFLSHSELLSTPSQSWSAIWNVDMVQVHTRDCRATPTSVVSTYLWALCTGAENWVDATAFTI